jgi:hypothetical protein
MPAFPFPRLFRASRPATGKRTPPSATRRMPLRLETLEDRLAPAVATPTFQNLSAPTIAYGTPTTILTGLLQSNSPMNVPAGETVQVTLNGVTQNATLNADDTFATTFNTGSLTVPGSPYTITFDYNPTLNNDPNFGPAETRSVLTVVQAAPVFTSSPVPIVYSTSPTIVSARLGSPIGSTVFPTGETVQVTLNGVTNTASLATNGTFTTSFDTSKLGVAHSPYTIGFAYAGDSNFAAATGGGVLTVIKHGTNTLPANTQVVFSTKSQTATLRATVTDGVSTIAEGSVIFTVLQGNNVIGTPVTANVGINGVASAAFTLAGLTPVANYTLQAAFAGSPNYNTSQSFATFTVDGPPFIQVIGNNNTLVVAHNPPTYTLPVIASSPVGNPLTLSSTVAADNPLFALQQSFHFKSLGTITAGATALVLQASSNNGYGNPFYLLRPSDGALFTYDGSGSFAHTYANVIPTATLGANVYLDPNLLFNAQAPIDYATLYNTQLQYQFTGIAYVTVGATAYVLHSNQAGPGVAGFYLLRSDGALFAYDGSGNFAQTFANNSPLATLDARTFANPSILVGATATPDLYAQLNTLNQQYDLQELGGSFYANTLGHNAEWFYSPILNQFGQHWYTLSLNANGTAANLVAWQGYGDSQVGATIASLDPSVFANPALLANATETPLPAVTTSFSANNLTINLPNYFYTGTFQLLLTASDGLLSTTHVVTVTVTDNAPTVTLKQGNTTVGSTFTIPHGNFPQSFTVSTADDQNDPVTTSVTVTASGTLFSLEQQYRFTGVGYFTSGAPAYVLQAPQANAFGDPFYLLNTNGDLYAFDGSGTYKDTFTNGTPIAHLGASVYNDPSLLMNAQPPVDYTTLFNLMQQYQFTSLGTINAGGTAVVLQSKQPGPGSGGFYLISPAGALYAYDGSGSFSHTFANSSPLAQVGAAVYANPALLTGARAAPSLYVQLQAAEQKYDLKGVGYVINGTPAYVLSGVTDPTNHSQFYLLNANGGLYAYTGSGNFTQTFANSANLRATLDPSVYTTPSLLTSAKSPVDESGLVTATINNGTLLVNAPASFVGSVVVNVSASDGILSSTNSVVFVSTDTAPVPTPVANQTASATGPALSIPLGATDAEGDTVTFTARAVAYSATFSLQQQYHFQGVGYVTTSDGVTGYVLRISGVNNNGNSFYVLSSTGALYAYDGSPTFSGTFANSANLVTTLDPSVYNTPTLLTQAQAPTGPTGLVSVNNNTLSVAVGALTPGTVFQVLVTANDGAETMQTSFLVTVTA